MDEGEGELDEDGVEAPEYKKLIAIHAGKPKGGVENWLRIDLGKVRRLSLSEQELETISKSHGREIVRCFGLDYDACTCRKFFK